MQQLHLTQINPIYPTVEPIIVEDVPFVIGRSSSCDRQLMAPTISRMHCRISVQGESYVIQDLESRNGTYVNEDRVKVSAEIQDGDELRIAFTTFRVSIRSPRISSKPSGINSLSNH